MTKKSKHEFICCVIGSLSLVSILFGTANAYNSPPIADAGGPYYFNVGEALLFVGHNSYDPDAVTGDSIVQYTWDIDGDGTDDFTGADLTLSWAYALGMGLYSPQGKYDIRLRVMDQYYATGQDTTFFTFEAAPVPIPGAVWLFGSGLAGLVVLRKRFAA